MKLLDLILANLSVNSVVKHNHDNYTYIYEGYYGNDDLDNKNFYSTHSGVRLSFFELTRSYKNAGASEDDWEIANEGYSIKFEDIINNPVGTVIAQDHNKYIYLGTDGVNHYVSRGIRPHNMSKYIWTFEEAKDKMKKYLYIGEKYINKWNIIGYAEVEPMSVIKEEPTVVTIEEYTELVKNTILECITNMVPKEELDAALTNCITKAKQSLKL